MSIKRYIFAVHTQAVLDNAMALGSCNNIGKLNEEDDEWQQPDKLPKQITVYNRYKVQHSAARALIHCLTRMPLLMIIVGTNNVKARELGEDDRRSGNLQAARPIEVQGA